MMILPGIAAVVSGLFAAALVVRARRSGGLHLVAWAVAMIAYSIASLTVAAGMGGGWDPTLYRVFWLFGALLNVPWLAAGSIALVGKRALGIGALALTIVGSAYALVTVIQDSVIASAFLQDGIPSSTEAWGAGSRQTTLVNFYSIVPYFVVVGIAVWSARPRKGVQQPVSRIRGNTWIAIGVTIVAVGGFALRRLDDSGAAFSVALALGVIVMFVGFLMAVRAPRFRVTDPGEQAT